MWCPCWNPPYLSTHENGLFKETVKNAFENKRVMQKCTSVTLPAKIGHTGGDTKHIIGCSVILINAQLFEQVYRCSSTWCHP